MPSPFGGIVQSMRTSLISIASGVTGGEVVVRVPALDRNGSSISRWLVQIVVLCIEGGLIF